MSFVPNPPTLHSLLELALTQVPALSRHLLEATQDELEARPQHFGLLDAWRRLRPRFTLAFEAALLPLLQAGRRGEDPLQRRATPLDALSLVDEQQALQDVAIAHVIHAIEHHNKTELHQLGNFFAALRGTARARNNDNPLRPALFAQALYQSLFGVELDGQRRYELMQVAASPMARSLHELYAALCGQLRDAELSQLVASHAANMQDADAHQRFAQARLQSGPATLDGLAQRVQARNTRPQGLSSSGPPAFTPNAGSGPDMLSRLYDQILADPRLLAPVKALLARLQVAVVRLARNDASLLRRQDHPTWQLLNRVAAHGMAFEQADDERLQAFLRFMEPELQLLLDSPAPSALLFQQVLARVEQHLSQQAQQRSERSAGALAALEREQQRPQWLQVLREQIDAQILDAPLGPRLRRFLQTHWVEVIVQAMVLGGRDAPQAHAAIDLVDQLLDSLQTPRDEAARQQLRQRLPGLIQGLRTGCDSIKLAEPRREPVLQELMQQHGRLLRGQSALPDRTPEAPQALSGNLPALSPEELLQRLLTERESQMPEHWAHTKVDRGTLPTVPVQLYTQYDSLGAQVAVAGWMDALAIGNWFHLFVQSQWLTAQIAWVSESRQFFLFVGQDAEERHSLTRGALEKLLANGLITALDEHSVVQRAVETLMLDLQDDAD